MCGWRLLLSLFGEEKLLPRFETQTSISRRILRMGLGCQMATVEENKTTAACLKRRPTELLFNPSLCVHRMHLFYNSCSRKCADAIHRLHLGLFIEAATPSVSTSVHTAFSLHSSSTLMITLMLIAMSHSPRSTCIIALRTPSSALATTFVTRRIGPRQSCQTLQTI